MSEYGEPWRIEYGSILRGNPETRDLVLGGWGDSATSPTVEQMQRIVACVNLLAGVPTEILDKILLASSGNCHDSPAADIREYIRRWHELNGKVWEHNEEIRNSRPPTWNGSEWHWPWPLGKVFPQPPAPPPAPCKTPLAQSAAPSTIEECNGPH